MISVILAPEKAHIHGPHRIALLFSSLRHAIVVGDQPVINIDVFTPARSEYAELPA